MAWFVADNALTGTIPVELGQLVNLETLDLSGNLNDFSFGACFRTEIQGRTCRTGPDRARGTESAHSSRLSLLLWSAQEGAGAFSSSHSILQ